MMVQKSSDTDLSQAGFLAFCSRRVIFFQAEDGIRDAQESRGLGDVYKRQILYQVNEQRVCKTTSKIYVCAPLTKFLP